jgi:hypothetical protein
MRMKRWEAVLCGKLGGTLHGFAGILSLRNHSNMKNKTSCSVNHNQDQGALWSDKECDHAGLRLSAELTGVDMLTSQTHIS